MRRVGNLFCSECTDTEHYLLAPAQVPCIEVTHDPLCHLGRQGAEDVEWPVPLLEQRLLEDMKVVWVTLIYEL